MSASDPKRTFPDCLKRDLDTLIPNQSVAELAVECRPRANRPVSRILVIDSTRQKILTLLVFLFVDLAPRKSLVEDVERGLTRR